MIKRFLLLFAFCLIISPLALQAGVYGTLKGRVTDKKSGEPIVGATIMLKGTNKGAVADKNGYYQVLSVNPGEYDIRVSAVSYGQAIRHIRISVDVVTPLDVQLSEEGVTTETVYVTSKMVENTEASPQFKLDNKDLVNVAREGITSILALSPGVLTSGSGFVIRGSRETETQIRVDGMDVGNQFTGGFGMFGSSAFPNVSSFALEEVQVLTGGFSAEYGEAMGGIVNQVLKTGSMDKYEGFLRFRTDLPSLWGSQANGLALARNDVGSRLQVVNQGDGKKLQGSNDNNVDFGVGGPIPLLGKTSFYISGYNYYSQYRTNSYEVYDPVGNNLGQLPHDESWKKNITGRIKFSPTDKIDFVVGAGWGMTNLESASQAWLYSTDQGILNGQSNGMSEGQAKSWVGDQVTSNYMARIKQQLNDKSYYELTISNTTNNDQVTKRKSSESPDFFNGFDVWYPQDNFVNLVQDNGQLKLGQNKVIDEYEYLTKFGKSHDGYLFIDLPQRDPLTGYIEGAANVNSTANPYGIAGFFNIHGNDRNFEFRMSNYWQVDGNYNLSVGEGDSSFTHMFKAGFEMRFYKLGHHNNSLPWDGNPFYDVYTSEWGGNLYTDNANVKALTSKDETPFRFSVYLQDQITYKGIIINPGLRLDYFDPNSTYRLQDVAYVPIGTPDAFGEASKKVQLSPRLNVTYPLTDRSNISISYGIFNQMPEMTALYDGYQSEVLRGSSIVGNPNLQSQRTNEYQVSYSNQLTDIIALTVSTYYKDLYDQSGMAYVPALPTPFFRYTVSDYGNQKGLEVTFRKNATQTDHIGAEINYNFAQTIGTSSNVQSNYGVKLDPYTQSPAFPLSEYIMGRDRTHRFNTTLNFVWFDGQGPSIGDKIHLLENTNISLVGFYQTGLPYTQTDRNGTPIGEINAERNPSMWQVDLRFQRTFMLRDYFGEGAGNTSLDLFVDVTNLLNRTVAVAYYSSTGDPDDDGISLERKPGDFTSTSYYKEANFGKPESFMPSQYDNYGTRLYTTQADLDHNGLVSPEETYQQYIKYLTDLMTFRGNYQAPRMVYVGLMFSF
jgi:outer membrane receptor protein involved in Fe transport